MAKELNINGVFRLGYTLKQIGQISFQLLNKDGKVLLEFEINEIGDTVGFVFERLLAELDYSIREMNDGESELEHFNYYFSEMNTNELNKANLLSEYRQEIELISDVLR